MSVRASPMALGFSARASSSSWFTRRVARSEPVTSWRRLDCISSGLASRSASSAWVRRPASGVLSWCAASATKRRCACTLDESRSSKSFIAATRGAISDGAARRRWGRGRRAGARAGAAGARSAGDAARDRPNHTSSTATGNTTNCGMITPLMMSLASWVRFSTVSAAISRAGCVSGRCRSTQVKASRIPKPRSVASSYCTSPGRGWPTVEGRGSARSPPRYSPRLPSASQNTLSVSSACSTSRAASDILSTARPSWAWTCRVSTWRLLASARS